MHQEVDVFAIGRGHQEVKKFANDFGSSAAEYLHLVLSFIGPNTVEGEHFTLGGSF